MLVHWTVLVKYTGKNHFWQDEEQLKNSVWREFAIFKSTIKAGVRKMSAFRAPAGKTE